MRSWQCILLAGALQVVLAKEMWSLRETLADQAKDSEDAKIFDLERTLIATGKTDVYESTLNSLALGGGAKDASEGGESTDQTGSASKYRVALICVYMGPLPKWLHYLMATAETQRPLIHFIIFHDDASYIPPAGTNVEFVLITVQTLAHRIRKILGEDCDFELNPRGSDEAMVKVITDRSTGLHQSKLNDYKAMYGALFEKELTSYTHWGWFDPDILVGPNFKDVVLQYIQADYDVITFPDGAVTALYLAGQVSRLQMQQLT
jgi:hypothetical protein